MLGMQQPLLLFVALSLSAAALVWLLPETAGAVLPDVRPRGRGRSRSSSNEESDEKLSLVSDEKLSPRAT